MTRYHLKIEIVLAHFTPSELPGTAAVLILGLCLGALLAARHAVSRSMLIVAISLLAFAILGYSGDVRGWPESTRQVIDLLFLAHAFVLAFLCVRKTRT